MHAASPQPISTPRFPLLAFTPFHLSYLCRSQCLAASCSLSTLSPSCDVLCAISYLFTSPSPAPLFQPVSNCVFPLHLAISLVSFVFDSCSFQAFFPAPSLLCATTYFSSLSLLLCSSSSFLYFVSSCTLYLQALLVLNPSSSKSAHKPQSTDVNLPPQNDKNVR